MSSTNQTAALSSKRLWGGRILSALAVLFLAFDGVVKVIRLPVALQGTRELGYPESAVLGIGVLQLLCLAVYLVPRTAVLGAVLLSGYLGGAVASQVRIGHPLFGYILFPVYVAAFLWAGLCLRDDRLARLFPVVRER
jgi:DoxX-like family